MEKWIAQQGLEATGPTNRETETETDREGLLVQERPAKRRRLDTAVPTKR